MKATTPSQRAIAFAILMGLSTARHLVVTAQAMSSPGIPPSTLAPVAVTGSANAAQISYSDLLAGVAAFQKYHHYAPEAKLSFYLKPAAQQQPVPAPTLELQTDDVDISVPVGADGEFVLPSAKNINDNDAYLVANRAAGTVGVVPTVRSAIDTDTRVRLGDLRLQCEVDWAIEKQHAPKAIRAFFFIGGRVCHSSKIAVNYFKADHKLAKAAVSYGKRQADVKILRDGVTYWAPIVDDNWPDDSWITLTYASASAGQAAP